MDIPFCRKYVPLYYEEETPLVLMASRFIEKSCGFTLRLYHKSELKDRVSLLIYICPVKTVADDDANALLNNSEDGQNILLVLVKALPDRAKDEISLSHLSDALTAETRNRVGGSCALFYANTQKFKGYKEDNNRAIQEVKRIVKNIEQKKPWSTSIPISVRAVPISEDTTFKLKPHENLSVIAASTLLMKTLTKLTMDTPNTFTGNTPNTLTTNTPNTLTENTPYTPMLNVQDTLMLRTPDTQVEETKYEAFYYFDERNPIEQFDEGRLLEQQTMQYIGKQNRVTFIKCPSENFTESSPLFVFVPSDFLVDENVSTALEETRDGPDVFVVVIQPIGNRDEIRNTITLSPEVRNRVGDYAVLDYLLDSRCFEDSEKNYEMLNKIRSFAYSRAGMEPGRLRSQSGRIYITIEIRDPTDPEESFV